VRAHDRSVSLDDRSPSNERIKAAVRLRDRGERDRTGLTIVDGTREIERALDAGIDFDHVFVCPPLLAEDTEALVERLRGVGAAIVTTGEIVQRKVAFGNRAEGVVAIVRQPKPRLADLRLPPEPLLVVLEGVEKPGNVGAVLRSADGAGADAVIAADPQMDFFNPNTIRASTGTVFSIPFAAAPADDVLAFLHDHGIRAFAARPDASLEYTYADLTGPVAIVLGSEASGHTSEWSRPDVTAVRLPMRGVADSLNVATTAAVLLYEAARQRQS
jgi:TrmH family RNA methyltransferase